MSMGIYLIFNIILLSFLRKIELGSHQRFVNRLIEKFPQRVGLCEPEFLGNEKKYLQECIDTAWVSTAGPFVKKFEQAIQDLSSCQYAIATNTGTAALHTLYLSAGIQPGDEVLTQSLTFVATVNAISYCQATPHFVDVANDNSLCICPLKLEAYLSRICTHKEGCAINKQTGRPIRALVIMHTFGRVALMDELIAVCQRYHIKVLEDAAEALGSEYKGKAVGGLGLGGVFSFNGNKIVTSGGGGVVVTNDKKLAEQARHISTTAKKSHPYLYDHDQVGFNYRMPNVNAAIALGQLERFSDILQKKQNLQKVYEELFQDLDDVTILKDEAWFRSNHWLIVAQLKNCRYDELSQVLKELNDKNICVRPVWKPIHKLSPYQNCPKDELSATELKAQSLVCLPSSSFLVAP